MKTNKININNYEEFILDYYDNNLDDDSTAILFDFLERNPKLKQEFNLFENVKIENNYNILIEWKNALKHDFDKDAKSIDENNCKFYFISKLENLLSSSGNKNVDDFLKKNSNYNYEYNLLKLTYLTPNKSIILNNKNSIKKQLPLKRFIYYISSAAAAIIIFVLAFNYIFYKEEIKTTHLAEIQHDTLNKSIDITTVENIKSASFKSKNNYISTIYNKPKIDYLKPIDPIEYKQARIDICSDIKMSYEDKYSNLYEYMFALYSITNDVEENNLYFNTETQVNDLATIENDFILINKPISLINLIEFGLKGYNYFTNNNVHIKRIVENNGQVNTLIIENNLEENQ